MMAAMQVRVCGGSGAGGGVRRHGGGEGGRELPVASDGGKTENNRKNASGYWVHSAVASAGMISNSSDESSNGQSQ